MSTIIKPREIRRLAFQWLYQLDACGDTAKETLRETPGAEETDGLTESEMDRAWSMACGAYDVRKEADAIVTELAPTWPANRQPAVDRAIFRLAYYEMHHLPTNPKTAVNEAVELAKKFSTERSPAFLNGLLDKLLKRVLAEEKGEPVAEKDEPVAEEQDVVSEESPKNEAPLAEPLTEHGEA